MQHFVNTVEQLNEAVRFISNGSIAHARMALLLLDNAAEVLIGRAAGDILAYDSMYARMYAGAERDMPAEEAAKCIAEIGRRVLTEKERRSVERVFSAKADLLVAEGQLDQEIAEVLKALHLHRNDAYHNSKTRTPILRVTAMLYLELCCELFLLFGSRGTYYSSADDWSDFMSRYGLADKFFMLYAETLDQIVAGLRRQIGIDKQDLAASLAKYLLSRIEVIEEQLDFLDYFPTHDAALQSLQFMAMHGKEWQETLARRGPSALKDRDDAIANFKSPITAATLIVWKEAADALATSTRTKPELFAEFRRLELELEPIEQMVETEAIAYDQHIQNEIDHARGK